jgi:VWFA-related protein
VRRVALLVFAVFLAVPFVTTATGQSEPRQATPVFKSAVSLVALNVAVQDARSRYVTGLQSPDFAVYEDGVRQDVRFCESTALPLDLILLLDTSRSMDGTMRSVQAAARGFMKTLREGDRGAVVTFNDHVEVLAPLTTDREALMSVIDSAHANGNTALHTALYISLKQFGRAARHEGTVRRQAIAVLSDGEDNASLVSFDDVVATARTTGVNIYTVRLRDRAEIDQRALIGAPRYVSEADYEMRALAQETGGLAFFPLAEQLRDVYGSIAEELASQYAIGYEPANRTADQRFRRVTVQVVSRPGLRTRTRLGYTTDTRDSDTQPVYTATGSEGRK